MKLEEMLMEVGTMVLDLGLEAKDSSNNLVAGYIRNFPQDSRNKIIYAW